MKTALAPLITAFNRFWQQRNERERRILLIGGSVMLFALVYSLAIDPSIQNRKRLARSLPTLRADAARFKRDISLIKGQTTTANTVVDIAALAASAGLPANAAQVERRGDKFSALHAKSVAWPAVTSLLASAQAQGWVLSKLSVHSPNAGASVDADVEWTR